MQTGINEAWSALRRSMRGCNSFEDRFAELRRRSGDIRITKELFGVDAHELCVMHIFMYAQISKASSYEDIRKDYLNEDEADMMWFFFSLLWNFLNEVAERGDV